MIAWLVETLIVTTMLMALVLAIREPVRRMFGAKVAYALWLLPALRVVMPPVSMLVPRSSPLAEIAQPGMISQIIRARIVQMDTVPVALQTGSEPQVWPLALAGLWLAGAIAFALWQTVSYRRFCRHVLDGARKRRSPARGIHLFASARVSGPMAFGLTRRTIVFPHDAYSRFDVEEHAMALAHELAHHRRGDLLANAFALAMLALHWCNPLAWIAHRAFRADQEMACDADVIGAIRDRGLGQAYGRALVKCASGREFSAICHLTTVDRLKRRLTMLSRSSPSLRRRTAGLALAGTLILAGLSLTASGEGMAAQVGAKVSDVLPIPRGQDLLPSLSTAPAALAAVADDRGDGRDQDAQAARDIDADLAVPPAPPVPAVPAAPSAPPAPPAPLAQVTPVPAVPPVPPVPPVPAVRQISIDRAVMRANRAAMRIPTQAEIEQRIPIIEVTEGQGCGGRDQYVNTTEQTVSVDGRERRKIHITICGDDIARHARAQAISGLQQARAEIVRNDALSERMRDRIVADLDRQIADMNRERD